MSRLALVALALLAAALPARAGRQRAGSLDVFVVLDESGSMKPIFGRVTSYLADALVSGYLEPGDGFCLIGFSDRPHVRLSQRLASPAERANLVRIVRDLNVVPNGYTDMGRALEELLTQLEGVSDPSHQQAVLILTDGLNQPPRDSPYFDPVRRDTGAGLAPPSRFNTAFHAQVERLAKAGHRVHVIGIGAETDARTLAEALGSGHTVVREFDPAEIERGLGNFWDDTLNLAALEIEAAPWLPGTARSARVRIASASDRDREVEVSGARLSRLSRLSASGEGAPAVAAIPVAVVQGRWAVGSRKQAQFELTLSLPPDFPAGDYEASLLLDQKSAVRFYPNEARLTFHVPSVWELHGAALLAGAAATLLLGLLGVLYARRPVQVVLQVEGEAGTARRPVRLPIGDGATIGGGATDRLRIAGLPQRLATLERRSRTRFAIVSAQPELLPTVPEYALGDPVVVRTGPTERRSVRFLRFRGHATARPARPAAPRPTRPVEPGGDVDF
jgi:hypothetical protein